MARTDMGAQCQGSGEYPGRSEASDAAAAQSLMYSIKSTMVPIHDAMTRHLDGNMTDYTDLSLRTLTKGEKLPVPST